jgi:hypothetical protein
MEESVYDIGVPSLSCFNRENGWAGDVAEEGEVIVNTEDEVVDNVETACCFQSTILKSPSQDRNARVE